MKFIGYVFVIVYSTFSWSQMIHPKASPLSIVAQEVGLSKISVSYSRPSSRGRLLFGHRLNGTPGLVPNGRIWRVGANESTKITFDTDVAIYGNDLKKGSYALYAFPGEDEWEIVFHTNLTHWGDGRDNYTLEEDALRIKVKPINTLSFQENLLISFDAITHNGLDLLILWGSLKIIIPITIDTHSLMENQIAEKLNNSPTAQTYYEIGRYYQEQGLKKEEALKYIDRALQMNDDTYYYHRVKSLLLADLGHYAKAIESAIISKKLANSLGKDEFVRLNENAIAKWRKLKK